MTRNVVRLVVLCVSVAIGASAARALGVSAAVGAAAGAVAAVVAILLEIRAAALPLARLGRVADTPDGVRRGRGRRGFEVLQRLQRLPKVSVEIDERAVAGTEVDQQLIELARARGGKLVTTDFNLNRLAELHGVPVLNVNELANALKPVVVPGEAMTVQVLREGKEPGQSVGVQDDGTIGVICVVRGA